MAIWNPQKMLILVDWKSVRLRVDVFHDDLEAAEDARILHDDLEAVEDVRASGIRALVVSPKSSAIVSWGWCVVVS